MKIYDRILDFCAHRNEGSAFHNGQSRTPRVCWIVALLEELCIPYELDRFERRGARFWNIQLNPIGDGRRWICAHHDIVNPNSDNANDNSASIINAIALKLERPDIGVILTDGEEIGGIGAKRFCERIQMGEIPQPEWILNLELTGKGGNDFFIGGEGSNGPLGASIMGRFDKCTRYCTPFNDAEIFRRHGLDSLVINPLPRLGSGEFDWSGLARCHSISDSLETIDVADMQQFVEEVLVPIMDV